MLETMHRAKPELETVMIRTSRRNSVLQQSLKALALGLFLSGWALARPKQPAVPAVNAALGPCSVDFTVSQSLNEPLYNALISVSIAYGFMGVKKMDLQIGTNSEGKARFEGLPERVHNPPLTFVVKHKGRTKTVQYWPQVECHGQYSVIMGAG
jgi:hypothetical protein